MSSPEELPDLGLEEREAFEKDIAHFEGGGSIPTPEGFRPINLNDPTPRQRLMLGILARALRQHKEGGNDGGKPGLF